MYGFLRAGGFAAAFAMCAALVATPSLATSRGAYDPTDVLTVVPKPVPAAQPAAAPVAAAPAPIAPAAPAVAAPAPGASFSLTTVRDAIVSAATNLLSPKPARRPLRDLVVSFVDYGNHDAEQLCLARAVYFEARGESLEGQLAVAQVVRNRAASGRYPSTLCGVVTQPAQFSFIRRGQFPSVNTADPLWRKALAIADIAKKDLAEQIAPNVLWYHASYVAPSWGRRLTRVAQIGTHIFYS